MFESFFFTWSVRSVRSWVAWLAERQHPSLLPGHWGLDTLPISILESSAEVSPSEPEEAPLGQLQWG